MPSARHVTLLLLLTLVAAPLAAQVAPGHPGVAGTVVDARTGEPLAEARVTLPSSGQLTTTDAQGRFALPGVPAGEHAVWVQRMGYQTFVGTWSVEPGAPVPVLVELEPAPVELEGLEARSEPFRLELDRRVRASHGSVRVFEGDDLERNRRMTVAEWVRMFGRVSWTTCPGGAHRDCVRRRGRQGPVGVFINGRRDYGGFDVLYHYLVDDVARVEVWNGVVIFVFTKDYMARNNRRMWIPPP